MPLRLLTVALLALLCCSACTPVRTVYDSMGNEVNEEENGGEKDLMSTFEKRFDAAFSEQKTTDGVPQTTSSKVSAFSVTWMRLAAWTNHFPPVLSTPVNNWT